jgi:phytoene dehydrogenase-like protein
MGYDFARGAVNVEEPVLLAVSPTIGDPTQAPPGHHTIKIIGMQPYDLKEGPQHWDSIKHEVAEANLNWLRRFSPNLTDNKILARVVESPLDLERRNPHNWHGSCHGGAQNAASRPMRPARAGRTACRSRASTRPARPRIRAARSRAAPGGTRRR